MAMMSPPPASLMSYQALVQTYANRSKRGLECKKNSIQSKKQNPYSYCFHVLSAYIYIYSIESYTAHNILSAPGCFKVT